MKLKFTPLLKACFITAFLLTVPQSCFIGKAIETPKMKREFTEENDAIPPDFGKEKTTMLVVLKGRGSYDRYLKSAVKNNYKGDYLIVSSTEAYSDKFDDTSKYRYLFDYSEGKTVTTTYSNGQSSSSVYKRFYVKDRSNGKMYQSGAEFTYFAKAMKIYFQNLEAKRLSN